MDKRIRHVATVLFLAVMAVSALMPGGAYAAEDKKGWFVEAGGGRYKYQHDMQSSVTTSNYAVRLYGGYQFFDYMGIEAGWVDFDRATFNASASTLEVESEGYHAKLFFQFPFSRTGNDYNAFYLSGGMWRWDLEAKNTTTTARAHGTSPTAGVGMVFTGKSVTLKLEYERFWAKPDITVFSSAYGLNGKTSQDLLSVNFIFY